MFNKKLAVAASVLVAAVSASSLQAQNLGNLLKNISSSDITNTVSKVVESVTGTTTSVSLPGSWKYTGAAVALKSENVLSNVAGSAVSASFEKKMNEAFQKVGIKEGSVEFTFTDGMSFSCKILGIPLSGTWKQNTSEGKVTLQFGSAIKYLSLTGYLKGTTSGCEMLFDADRFLTFMKQIISYAGNKSTTLSTISSLSNSYKGLQLGFKLAKR